MLCAVVSFCFHFSFHRSFNLLHPRFTMSCASLSLLQDMFSAEPVRSCYRPPSKKTLCASRRSVFLFFLFFHRSFNLLHPRFTMSCASLSLLQDMFSAEPVRSCYRPPLKKTLCALRRSVFFVFPFLFISYLTSCIRVIHHAAISPSKKDTLLQASFF